MKKKGMRLKIGDSIGVRKDTMCPDMEDLCIGGWQGRVSEIGEDDDGHDLICINWDSITLKNLPRYFIEQSRKDGLEYASMYLWPENVILAESRDAEEDVTRTLEDIRRDRSGGILTEEGGGKTIEKVFKEFLSEQQARLKPRTYKGYEEVIDLFGLCLNGIGYCSLDHEDSSILEKLVEEEDREYCEVFGPDKISYGEIAEFLDYFLIRKVVGSKTLMETAGRVMRKFVKWMKDKGYMDVDNYTNSIELIDDLKDDLPKVGELSDLIYDYIQNNSPSDYDEEVDGYFTVIKIEPGRLWLEDYLDGEPVGPVLVSKEISSICKEGWAINLSLGQTDKGWEMLESGFVYQR